MMRRLIPPAILLAALLGCSKKKDPVDAGSGGGEEVPTGPVYSIQLRKEKAGDKVQMSETAMQSSTIKATGKLTKTDVQQGSERFEYVDTALEMSADGERATKATHAYTVAEFTSGSATKRHSYAGKTVQIEKKGPRYSYTVAGKGLPAAEAARFQQRFEKAEQLKREDMLPSKPVQVFEKWSIAQTVMKKLATAIPFKFDIEMSTGTARLTKAYTRDGQQWAVLELKLDLVLGGAAAKEIKGNLTLVMTLDTAIDGSSLDGVQETKLTGRLTQQPAPGVDVETAVHMESRQSRTTLK